MNQFRNIRGSYRQCIGHGVFRWFLSELLMMLVLVSGRFCVRRWGHSKVEVRVAGFCVDCSKFSVGRRGCNFPWKRQHILRHT